MKHGNKENQEAHTLPEFEVGDDDLVVRVDFIEVVRECCLEELMLATDKSKVASKVQLD